MEWGHQSEGPDFEVCYATLKGSKTIVFGIYLGNFPSFDAKKGTSLGEGKIGGRSITWYRMSGTSNPASLSRQALLMLNEKEGYVAHVWVYANTTQELESRLSVLQHITFNK